MSSESLLQVMVSASRRDLLLHDYAIAQHRQTRGDVFAPPAVGEVN